MSTAVMNTPMFECSEHLFKNAATAKTKEVSSTSTTNNSGNGMTGNNGGHAPLRRSYSSLVTTLIEQHRKLDRSASEPTSRYKTELCRPFEESGACKYGDKCQFAHGYSELRNLARHPKYKTELCRTFHTIGFCPYGPRCHFIHNFEEARIHNQKVSAQLGSTQPNIISLQPTNSLSLCNNSNSNITYNPPPLLRTNSFSLTTTQHHHHHHHHHHHQTGSTGVSSVIGATRPKPLNPSPTFSLGSTGDSISPPSSLSQSPTNSMASFFSDDCSQQPSLSLPTTAFSFGQDFGLLATRQSPSPRTNSMCSHLSSDELTRRTPSPLSQNADSRLPVFNRISSTLSDFENMKIQ